MWYLAQVEKNFMRRGTLKILLQRKGSLWTSPLEESLALPSSVDFNDGILVIAEVDSDGALLAVSPAASQIAKELQQVSLQMLKTSTKEVEIKAWRQSLEYQSKELAARSVSLDKREIELNQTSHELQEQMTEVKKEHEFLKLAWQQLRSEQERLTQQKWADE